MPITYGTPDYATNESLKSFDTPDSLAKSYLDLDARVKGGGIELLPEELRKDPALAVFKTLPDLAKGYVETKKMVGSIEKAPEKPEGYKFTPLANLNAKLKADVITTQLGGILHKAGMGNKAADVVNQGVLTLLSNNMAQQEKAKADLALANETALRGEYGSEFDAKFDKVVKVMQLVGGKEMAGETDQIAAALKGSPNFLKGMIKLTGLLSEDSIMNLGEGGDRPVTDAKGAQEAIQKYNSEILAGGIKHPYNDEKSPEHGTAKKKMDDLFKLAFPQQ